MISGLKYIDNFIAKEEEHNLIKIIDSNQWSTQLKRRTQQYGYKYDYTNKKIDMSMYIGEIPDWIIPYSNKIMKFGFFKTEPNQIIINEYMPGQGIYKHIDSPLGFGDTIASLSLGSSCAIEFEQASLSKTHNIILSSGSLLVLSGEARYNWSHSIPARMEDTFENKTYIRSRRVSLTFRNVIEI